MPPLGSELLAPFEVGLSQHQGRLLALVSRHVGPKVGDLVVHLLHGRLQLPTLGSADRLQSAHLGFGGHQVRFGGSDGGSLDRDLNLVGLLVELDQQVPPLHAVVVVHQHPAHLAGDPGSHEGHVAVDIGVVGGNRVEHRFHDGDQEVPCHRQAGDDPVDEQPSPPATRRRPRWRRGGGRTGCGVRGLVVRMGSSLGLWKMRAIPRFSRHSPGRSRPWFYRRF